MSDYIYDPVLEKLNILIVFFTGKHYGMGHKVRSLVLADELERRGHHVVICTNEQLRGKTYFQSRPFEDKNSANDLYHIFNQFHADWVVIDTPYTPDKWIVDRCKEIKADIALLNASGDNGEDVANVCVVQGILDPRKFPSNPIYFYGIDYIILRPELATFVSSQKMDWWFVFGGAEDRMKLVSKFQRYAPTERAVIPHSPSYTPDAKQTPVHQIVAMNNDRGMMELMGVSQRACIAFGMTAWELAYLGVPAYTFAFTKTHMKFAKGMQTLDLIRVHDKIGIPNKKNFTEFIHKPFEVLDGNRPDLNGVSRVADILVGEEQ